MTAKMVTFHMPDDPAFLAAVGSVALRHTHLDHVLRMVIKSLSGASPDEARLATAGNGSAELRGEVRALGKMALGNGPAFIMLRAMLKRAEVLTRRRNELMHGICAREINPDAESDGEMFGMAVMLDEELGSRPLPSNDELLALAEEIGKLVDLLNGFRLHRFAAPAMPDLRAK